MYKGSCLCGGITWRLDGEPHDFNYCHCTSCRKASGSSFAANATVMTQRFTLADPRSLLREYESSPGKLRAFCGRCGAPVYARRPAAPETLRIRMGTMDTSYDEPPVAHIFVADRAPWDDIADDVPQHPGPR